MWPYDYFNEYSALKNEFDIEEGENKKRKVFVGTYYSDTKREEIINEAIGKAVKNISIINNKEETKIEDDLLRYLLEMSMPKYTEKGDITADILGKIIESRIIVCDITPINIDELLHKKVKKENIEQKDINLNANVVFEVGLALAWKIPEQVIIVYDKRFSLKDYKFLPFDVQGYFVKEIDFENKNIGIKELSGFLIERLEQINSKKNIIIKNIKSKLDAVVLNLLLETKGLPFSPVNLNLEDIRYLLDLDIIRAEQFPLKIDGKMDHIYYFTELGRFILEKGLGVKPFPKMLADLYIVRYWEGYKETNKDEFEQKHERFQREHKISWSKCAEFLIQIFKRNGIIIDGSKDIVIFYQTYLRIVGKTSDSFMNEIVELWKEEVGASLDVSN
jgi:hypothetical protein